MKDEYILAIDLGTTNCKTILLNRSCQVIGKEVVEYSVSVPRSGWAEQNPETWWAAIKESVKRVLQGASPDSVRAVGLSGQMHGLVLLDQNGAVLRPAILWNDQRSFEECEEIYACAGGPDGLLEFTNNPMIPGYTGGKILWVRKHEPEIYQQISKLLLPKDYLRFRLTGAPATDVSDASGSGLFNVKERKWAFDLIDKLDIPSGWFPDVFESQEIIGEVCPEAALELGLKPHTLVIAGGGDAVMQTIGSAATNPAKALIVVGTGGNVTVSLPAFAQNPKGRLQSFCHVLPSMWIAMGVTLTAGSSLKWFRDTLGEVEIAKAKASGVSPYELLGEAASKSPPGSHGVFFMPYLQGERCPHVDVHASGAFLGIRLNTEKSDLIRSVMEGVTFSLRDVLELLVQTGARPEVIHLSGGGSLSPLWRQIHADILNREVITLDSSEDASAVGAGVIAGISMGFWSSAEQGVDNLQVKTVTHPIEKNAQIYQEMFSIYKELYPAVKPSFDKIALL